MIRSIATNQTEVTIGGNRFFVSYETPVAAYMDGTYYKENLSSSRTTARHINKWLGSVGLKLWEQEVVLVPRERIAEWMEVPKTLGVEELPQTITAKCKLAKK
jgi:hypothetical protein